ncbi:MAG: Holliday junction branch migration protein RuvA [Pseudomonadota bacterium]
MIGRLAGRLALRSTDHVMIDVGGVGYVVHCSERTLAGLPGEGEWAALWTDLLVREDLMQLFGFASLAEREWHRLLTSVQGVGAKASMAILGTLGPDALTRAIAIGDWGSVKAAPGVGPKLAQRVVNELKDKAPAAMARASEPGPVLPEPALPDPEMPGAPAPAVAALRPPTGPTRAPDMPASAGAAQAEALSALANLGYAPTEAAGAVARAFAAAPEANTQALIRAALRALAPEA